MINLYKYEFDKFILYCYQQLNKHQIGRLKKIDNMEDLQYTLEKIPYCFLILLPEKYIYFNEENVLKYCFDKDIISLFMFPIDPEILHEDAKNYAFISDDIIEKLDEIILEEFNYGKDYTYRRTS